MNNSKVLIAIATYKEAENICSYFKIDMKVCEKFSKYFIPNHKKEVQKLFKK